MNWNQLRPWNGSYADAFEELCCQLAACEKAPQGSQFVRKGRPDAGLECYWLLPNGDEWGWQAKFFRTSPTQGQWSEIDVSVLDAIKKHPRMTKCTICLPVDRPDARRMGQTSCMEKWLRHVVKWQRAVKRKGMSVTFDYWGQSEIGSRLSKEENRGRNWFWFADESLSNAWFKARVEEAISNARDRYTPKPHIDLPIRADFDALGRNPKFVDKMRRHYSDLSSEYRRFQRHVVPRTLEALHRTICSDSESVLNMLSAWAQHDGGFSEWIITQPIPFVEIARLAERAIGFLNQCLDMTRELKPKRDKTEESDGLSQIERTQYILTGLRHALDATLDFSQSAEAKISNTPSLLLVGAAGQGKTHLLCDIAEHETDSSRPCMLFHGEHFEDAEPWQQMTLLSGLRCTPEEFIGVLESSAQANRCRILIFIDALNEGNGSRLWRKHLPGLLTRLAHSRWLGIAFSVRTCYEEMVLPDDFSDQSVIRIEHTGFAQMTPVAVEQFFAHYEYDGTRN